MKCRECGKEASIIVVDDYTDELIPLCDNCYNRLATIMGEINLVTVPLTLDEVVWKANNIIRKKNEKMERLKKILRREEIRKILVGDRDE